MGLEGTACLPLPSFMRSVGECWACPRLWELSKSWSGMKIGNLNLGWG